MRAGRHITKKSPSYLINSTDKERAHQSPGDWSLPRPLSFALNPRSCGSRYITDCANIARFMRRCDVKNYGIERTVIRGRQRRTERREERRGEEGRRGEEYTQSEGSGFAFQSSSNVTRGVKGRREQIKIYRLHEADILTAINILNPGAVGQSIGRDGPARAPCWGRH